MISSFQYYRVTQSPTTNSCHKTQQRISSRLPLLLSESALNQHLTTTFLGSPSQISKSKSWARTGWNAQYIDECFKKILSEHRPRSCKNEISWKEKWVHLAARIHNGQIIIHQLFGENRGGFDVKVLLILWMNEEHIVIIFIYNSIILLKSLKDSLLCENIYSFYT